MSESEAVSVIYHTVCEDAVCEDAVCEDAVCEDAVVPVRLDESADSALV